MFNEQPGYRQSRSTTMVTGNPARFHRAAAAIALWICVLLVGAALPAAATLRVVEQAYELDASQLRLSPGSAGPLSFRRCQTCPLVTLQITAETTWHLGSAGAAIARAEFVRLYRGAALDRRALAYVFYRPGDGVVTRVVLDRPVAPGSRS